ncbi:uncharacterized protein VTP21DRAFT_6283 [Calcarisporiella thermophila]|uniref:uncharacterized protein n=1 Tax=Calcarisporiella thermophila TaxID=911321 RepID=UPI0037432028
MKVQKVASLVQRRLNPHIVNYYSPSGVRRTFYTRQHPAVQLLEAPALPSRTITPALSISAQRLAHLHTISHDSAWLQHSTTAANDFPHPLHPWLDPSVAPLPPLSLANQKLAAASVFDYFDKSSTRYNFVFAHGAAGIPKRPKKVEVKGATLEPFAGGGEFLSIQVGEDAYFCRHDSLGVADGVGGWHGVKSANPAFFSRMLMHYAYVELEKYDNIECDEFQHYYEVDPVEILQASYESSVAEATRQGIVGSSTACIAILRDDELRIANLGDCGVSIIRQNDFVFRTEEQQHSFNFPYQLGTGSSDVPRDAQTFTVKVQKNDIVILASDGVYDNLFDEDILDEVIKHVRSHSPGTHRPMQLRVEPQVLCDALVRRARSVSEDTRNLNSPFQERAMQQGLYHQGGKADDISVLVAVVTEASDSPDRR